MLACMAVLATEKPGISVREVGVLPQQQQKETLLPPRSPIIIGPPSTLAGFTLELVGNTPSPVTPQEKASYLPKALEAHNKLLGIPGYFNPIKVNITSAEVVTKTTPDGEQKECIQYTTAPSEYMFHRTIINKDMPYETARHFTHAGGNIVWQTGDGYLVLASRPDNNQYYPRTLEASASGGWDGQLQKDNPSLLVPPTPDAALHHIKKETYEELGIPFDQQTHITILGIHEEPIKKVWDILYYGKLPPSLTKSRLTEMHQEGKKNGLDNPDDPMAGHLTFIPATPRAVRSLLTRLQTPINPIASNALLLTGYMLRLEELQLSGVPQEVAARKATKWMETTRRHMDFDKKRIEMKLNMGRRIHILQREIELLDALLNQPSIPEDHVQKIASARRSLQEAQATPKGYNLHRPPAKQTIPVPEVKPELQRIGVLPDNKQRGPVASWARRRRERVFTY